MKKRRPVVIVTSTASISAATKVRVVGISASFRPDDPDVIPLAWRQDGNIYTGLRKPCAISMALQDDIDPKDLVSTGKWVGKAALIEMLERMKQ